KTAYEIVVTVGGSEGIDIAMRAMLNPGDEVLIPQPSYVSYLPCAVLADGVPVVIPLQEKNKFKLTRDELEEKITDRTKILVLPFPNNPTGSIMTKEDLEPIAEAVVEHDLFVISDEIYSELTYGTDHVRSEEHTSELQSRFDLVCRLLLEKKKNIYMSDSE